MFTSGNHDLVVIGGSAGGLQAVLELVGALSPDLPATLLLVLHSGANGPRTLDRVIDRATMLDCVYAEHGAALEHGRIYVAPPGVHMILVDDHLRLVHGPTENRARPSIDVLFRSVAITRGWRAIGVVLSGLLSDGAAGLAAIKRCGGLALVQDPSTVTFSSMPRSAMRATEVDGCAAASELSQLLVEMVYRPIATTAPEVPKDLITEARMVVDPTLTTDELEKIGRPSTMVCPECGGTLYELHDQRYRCRVGHAYGADHMVFEHEQQIDLQLWTVLRTVQNAITLHRKMLAEALSEPENNNPGHGVGLRARIKEFEAWSNSLRKLLLKRHQ
ncbi:chemotaxis protein CheB [Enhygromyxa salina]|uniref:protein-glutamate methylesterase n=1 Tax=Enhygromyxa salina TaxID=215803 RepID=A0A2S9YG06_9BACT|nr:chemotaxis protein CheB [Enhygromyxa salina]PRQ03936.1 Chemotaxis response regulator protein-glutamate methylesterase [Enhygromyxa salina]